MKKYNNILFVDLSTIISGAQKVTLNIVSNLYKKNRKIHILCRKLDQGISKEYKTFSHKHYSHEHLIKSVFGTGNFSLKNTNFFNKVKLIYLILILNIQTIYFTKRLKCNTIYCYDPKGLIASCLLSRLFKIKVIWHLHGELNYSHKLNRILCKIPDTIIVPSKYIQKSIRKYRFSHVVYNGFDFNNKRKSNIVNKNSIQLLYAGTLVPHKGLHNVLEALSKIKNNKQYLLRVLGAPIGKVGDKYLEKIKNDVRQLPPNIKVEFHGWVNDVSDFIEKSDITLFSSIKEGELILDNEIVNFKSSEALPTIIIESLSLGIPVISTNIAGVKEIMTRNNDGIIIEDFLTIDIAECIDYCLNHCLVNPNKIISKFNINSMIHELEKILSE
ncbi:glycosyltransferase family 4 protein [Xenorhabdus anantnagensis]|uniref:Glycosyltransferase family 4 protein n=1 Tax=Xenorhabdus anantnagensis TaxID=3025875 RepID=A0ABT5LSJ5_9GAMM|nr:glycosyltransferase family 4 protein [Xenorhabdus anantnagensis]MDC9596813.1 glycosyltransferase family 4 protein [Xenorhabdus anantnagensis]